VANARSTDDLEATSGHALKRSHGRRYVDHVKTKGWWVLLVGALLQGGFLTMSWRLMNMGERQLDREREMIMIQHREIVAAMRDQADAVRELTKEIRVTRAREEKK
jgi:hypothetical protein